MRITQTRMKKSESAGKRTATRRSFKKEFAGDIVATKLWAADNDLFNEFVGRKRTTPAALLREIVHEWAMTVRVSGKARDSLEMAGPIRRLHEQIIADQLAPVNDALANILHQLSPNVATGTTLAHLLVENLTATNEELARLKSLLFPNYILATQTFANTWAALQLIQTYLAGLTNEQAVEEAEELRDSFRKDGMSMAILVTNRHLPPRTIGFKLLAVTPEDES